ncbi:hypothetical protein SAMN05428951_12446 [Pseudomonas sp. OV546]|nr:hypothetical protein SAMN05428951_12446 [Pseudomonas sp. OV546]
MKNQQDNISTLPALLRTPVSVETLETNSLCCAAVGIIAPSSATAEALLPHEKLRGAALSDATLTTLLRPLAQPVMGFNSKLEFLECLSQRFKNAFIQLHAGTYRTKLVTLRTSDVLTGALCCALNVVCQLKKWLDHLFLRQADKLNTFNRLVLPFNELNPTHKIMHFVFDLIVRSQIKKLIYPHTRCTRDFSNSGDDNTIFFKPTFLLISLLPTRNSSGSPNSPNRTDCLHPSRGVVFSQVGETQPNSYKKNCDSKRGQEKFLHFFFWIKRYCFRQHCIVLILLAFGHLAVHGHESYRGHA